MTTAQMNVRIDDKLKAEGDAVFSSLGLNPSEVVRAVWSYAAAHKSAPAIVTEALNSGSDNARAIEAIYRETLARNAHSIVSDFRAQAGLPSTESTKELDYRAMREAGWTERLSERGLE